MELELSLSSDLLCACNSLHQDKKVCLVLFSAILGENFSKWICKNQVKELSG